MSAEGSNYEDIAEFQHPILAEGYEFKYEDDLVVTRGETDVTLHFIVATSAEEQEIRIEITDEVDIYWVVQFVVKAEGFREFAKTQPFKKVTFETFVPNIVKILENVKTNRSSFSGTLTENEDEFDLVLRQQLEFKRVDIFNIKFDYLPNDFQYVLDQAQFRYSYKLAQFDDSVQRLNDLFDHVEGKNPQLCQQLKKGSKFGQK